GDVLYHEPPSGSFGGLRDGHAKRSTPTAPQRKTGRRNPQPVATSTSMAVHVPVSDDPLPTTRECEKNIRVTINAAPEMKAGNNPTRRLVEMLINVLPPNCHSATSGSFIQTRNSPVLLCVSRSLSAALDLDIRRLGGLLQALNSAHGQLQQSFR
ncbi:MAG TPA: hypothetical protein VN829_14855, partial [Dongiaceae bacterium]|nr:hypothetical protein [Dongiaceae bacterium]